jgi:hypothetical protein
MMSKFFKTLRKRILTGGTFSKYLKYAFGEILLTILGIILALQIHTWAEDRFDRQELESIAGNLSTEFELNKKKLETTLESLQSCLKSAKIVIGLVGKDKTTLRQYNLDSLLAVSFQYKKFGASQDVIAVLINSNELKLLEDSSMKQSLYDWSSDTSTLADRFDDLDTNTSKVFGYLTQNYSLKDLDYYTSERLLGKSNLPVDKFAVFDDIVFENHLDNHIYYLHSYVTALQQTAEIIDRILQNSEKYKVPEGETPHKARLKHKEEELLP